MRTLFTSRHLSAHTPPAGDAPEDVVEDANDDSGTPSFFFLAVIVSGVLLLAWLLAPRTELRPPLSSYEPAADPAVDAYAVVDAEAGVYRVPAAVMAKKVVSDASMLAPIAPAGGFVEIDTSTPEGEGQALFAALTCNACHSLDGAPMAGPTLQGILGRAEKLTDGSEIVVDEAYLVESIQMPMAKIVEGFAPAMVLPRTPTEEEVAQLVAYLKTL